MYTFIFNTNILYLFSKSQIHIQLLNNYSKYIFILSFSNYTLLSLTAFLHIFHLMHYYFKFKIVKLE